MRNTAWGNTAYKETKRNGGTKSECKQASLEATEKYHKHTQQRQFGSDKNYESKNHDFDSDINGNGTRWHTADDL